MPHRLHGRALRTEQQVLLVLMDGNHTADIALFMLVAISNVRKSDRLRGTLA